LGTASVFAYPDRPIELVVAYAPGGTTDTIGRIIASELSEKLGQPVVVENRAGATGQLGSQYVKSATPDGYVLQVAVQTTHAVAPTFYGDIGYDPVADFTAIGQIVGSPLVLITSPQLEVDSVGDLIDWISARPDEVSYATGGNGDGSHMAALFFNQLTGLSPQFIPHQGEGPAVPQVIGGHLPYMFVLVPTGTPFVTSGEAKGLAVTGTSRSPALPDVPTMQEAGLDGYSMETWWGIFGPADMPEDVVATLSTALEDIMSDPEVQERITRMGFEVRYSSPDEFTQFVVDENVRWAEIIEAQGLVGGGRM
jgi:tripartite-type tricarboxylate transporter receptor subunit TctC